MEGGSLAPSAYKMKTPQFEGPLELLLELVERRKLFISDFSLAKVADEYMIFIRTMNQYPLGDVAQFIVVAATLVLLKSKSLLPQLLLSGDETESIDDLKRRLLKLEKFRGLGLVVRSLFGNKTLYFREPPQTISVFAPHASISLESIRTAASSAIKAFPQPQKLPETTVRNVMSLEEMMDNLADRIKNTLKMSFNEFTKGKKGSVSRDDRVHIIVGFLAMLELVKQGILLVTQETQHGDIQMETQDFSTPTYG